MHPAGTVHTRPAPPAGTPRGTPAGSRDEAHQTPILVVDDDPQTLFLAQLEGLQGAGGLGKSTA